MTEPAVETQTEYAVRCADGTDDAHINPCDDRELVQAFLTYAEHGDKTRRTPCGPHAVVSRSVIVTRTPWTPVEAQR